MSAVRVLVPVKRFSLAKTRLAGVLAEKDRAALAKAMLQDTLDVLGAASGVTGVALVTSDQEAARIGQRAGTLVLEDPGVDLNGAVTHGRDELYNCYREDALLVLPADLPILTASDIENVIGRGGERGSLVVSPAHDGDGTNALLTGPDARMRYAYGAGSFRKHLAGGLAVGLTPIIARVRGIGMDLDTPDDLAGIKNVRTGPRTARVLGALACRPEADFGEVS